MSGRGGPGWGGEWKLRDWRGPRVPVHDAAGLERLERAVDEANVAVDAIEKRLRLGPKNLSSVPSLLKARDHLAVVLDDLERGRAAARADGTLVSVPEESNHPGDAELKSGLETHSLTVKGTEEGTR